MSAGGLAPALDLDQVWALLSAPAPQPTEAEVAELVRLSTHFPRDTKVIVTPAAGSAWRGVVESWTEPGSGRPMAVVRPNKTRGDRAGMYVLPAFVRHANACSDCRTRKVVPLPG